MTQLDVIFLSFIIERFPPMERIFCLAKSLHSGLEAGCGGETAFPHLGFQARMESARIPKA